MMRMTYMRWATGLTVVLALAALAGCLISGTKVFSYTIGDLQARTDDHVGSADIDLNSNDTYSDYKDKIRLVDRFGFSCSIENLEARSVTVSAYFTDNGSLSTPDAVRNQATPLFLDFQVGANATEVITYDRSLDLLLNFDKLQPLIEDSGVFYFYAIANSTNDLLIHDLVLTVTLTAGL